MTLSVNWCGDGRRVVALTAVAMSERNEAEQHSKEESEMNPKVIKVSNNLPCKKCGKVMMIPRDRGICIPCLSKKNQK